MYEDVVVVGWSSWLGKTAAATYPTIKILCEGNKESFSILLHAW